MKKIFRLVVALIIVSPIALYVYVSSIFVGREKAIKSCAPLLTRMAKGGVDKSIIPKIETSADFGKFKIELMANYRFWKPLYDYSLAYEDNDTIKFNFQNCPLYVALNKFRLPEMCLYVCQGDWEVAKKYANKWEFDREHQIANGDNFCGHTYKRLAEQKTLKV